MSAGNLAASAPSLLTRVRAAITAATPFRVDFRQQVSIDGTPEAVETGDILFASPTRLKWTYQKPDRKVFLLDGDRYQFLNGPERQLLRGRITSNSDRLLWQLLAEAGPTSGVEVREQGMRLSIVHREGDELHLLEVDIGPGNLPAVVTQEDGSGVRSETRFSRYRPRVPVLPADLTLTVPPGTEIVDE